jgi:DNA-binding MarR family transcriptional regulator
VTETREHESALPSGLADDLGWLLARALRPHVQVRGVTLAGFPGGPRGFLALQGAANFSVQKQIELARLLGIDRTVMVYLIDDLVKADLVERRPDPADRRNRLIVITETGRKRLAETTAELMARDDALLEPLSAEERESLRGMLQRLAVHAIAEDGLGDVCTVADEPC